jgi:hypothetical protein
MTLIVTLLTALVVAACGGKAAPTAAPAAAQTTKAQVIATKVPPAAAPVATQPPALEIAKKAPIAAAACEDYFGFCVTAQVSGAVTSQGRGGWGSSANTDCKAWAAAGAARILELPLLLAAGEQKITVALTRLAAYTGPGTYEMKAQVASPGIPDMLPALEVAGRTFGNGPDSTAVATIAADGSGSVQVNGLVEQGANPDPNARISLAMQWMCQGKK